jgi:hypothetical protein
MKAGQLLIVTVFARNEFGIPERKGRLSNFYLFANDRKIRKPGDRKLKRFEKN